MADSNYLNVAKKAALEAGEIIKKYLGKEHRYLQKKGVHNFATEADLEAEEKIVKLLKKAFPEHGILAEEGGFIGDNRQYRWLIDPLDGTIQFDSGMPFYAVSIALLKDGQPIIGVINQAGTDELYWAEQGKGGYVNNHKLSVSSRDKIENCSLMFDLGRKNRAERVETGLRPFLDGPRYVYLLGGSAVCLAYLGRGFTDGYIHEANPWDFAAGAIIVEEAGGKVTDHQGGPIDWTNEKIYLTATNGLIHDQLIEVFNS